MAATWREILYGVVFVAMHYTQLDAVMDTLKENQTENIVFVGNNVRARDFAASLPEIRWLLWQMVS